MRKTKTITITAEGRDKGKVFIVREMAASQAERWGVRMMEALAKSGAVIPEEIAQGGLAAVAMFGFRAVLGAPSEITLPLLDEMFDACVSIVPDPKNPGLVRGATPVTGQCVGPLIDDDTEEVATRLLLRSEVFELHTGFSLAAFLSRRWTEAALLAGASNTSTSGESSERSSQPGSPA